MPDLMEMKTTMMTIMTVTVVTRICLKINNILGNVLLFISYGTLKQLGQFMHD